MTSPTHLGWGWNQIQLCHDALRTHLFSIKHIYSRPLIHLFGTLGGVVCVSKFMKPATVSSSLAVCQTAELRLIRVFLHRGSCDSFVQLSYVPGAYARAVTALEPCRGASTLNGITNNQVDCCATTDIFKDLHFKTTFCSPHCAIAA